MRLRRWATWAIAAVALMGAGVVALDVWIATTPLLDLTPAQSVEIRARGGELLRAYTVADGRWRFAVAPEDVDPTYLAILLAYEDQRFFTHPGVDVRALARAAAQALRAGEVVSGASTLTMQVARLLEGGTTGSWSGKIRQVRVALALERRVDKQTILALYLHLAPMGANLEGVRAGSLSWFGHEPTRLTEAEAALLVALPQAPAARDPAQHPEAARAARDRVLARAAAVGAIDADAAAAAMRERLPTERRPFPALAPHLSDRLRSASGDGVHTTTIDANLQSALEEVAARHLARLSPDLSVAILAADPTTGEILATVGSGDYTNPERSGFLDMTRALRSPGSTLKPLVYGLAFSDALAHPETILRDVPANYDGYAPANFDERFRGDLTARAALQASSNLPAVALTDALGPARLLSALRASGVRVVVPGDAPGLAIALGGLGIDLEGLVTLYAAIARGGEAIGLHATPAGADVRAQLMTPQAAWHVADVLAGTPRPAHALASRPLAFKTGTSHGHRDALAIGFDGAVVVGVWVGRADNAAVPGLGGTAVAAPLLFEAFTHASPHPTPLPPAPPGTLIAATAELPSHLQRFGVASDTADAPQLTFPPDGAALTPLAGGLPARVERGEAPFTWFVDGAPLVIAGRQREERLEVAGPGFVTLSVVDARGRGDAVRIELR